MRRYQRRFVIAIGSLAAALGLCFGAVAPASAVTTHPPEGGTWNYGVDYLFLVAYSNYHHPDSVHGSTACSANACTRSEPTPAGLWSYASRRATWGGNTAYYRVG